MGNILCVAALVWKVYIWYNDGFSLSEESALRDGNLVCNAALIVSTRYLNGGKPIHGYGSSIVGSLFEQIEMMAGSLDSDVVVMHHCPCVTITSGSRLVLGFINTKQGRRRDSIHRRSVYPFMRCVKCE